MWQRYFIGNFVFLSRVVHNRLRTRASEITPSSARVSYDSGHRLYSTKRPASRHRRKSTGRTYFFQRQAVSPAPDRIFGTRGRSDFRIRPEPLSGKNRILLGRWDALGLPVPVPPRSGYRACLWVGSQNLCASRRSISATHADRIPAAGFDALQQAGDGIPVVYCSSEAGQVSWRGWASFASGDGRSFPQGDSFNAIELSLLEAVQRQRAKPQVIDRWLNVESAAGLLETATLILDEHRSVSSAIPPRGSEKAWIARNVTIHPSAQLCPPFSIEQNCRIGANARIGPYAMIGENCMVEKGSIVSNSLVASGTYIGRRPRTRAGSRRSQPVGEHPTRNVVPDFRIVPPRQPGPSWRGECISFHSQSCRSSGPFRASLPCFREYCRRLVSNRSRCSEATLVCHSSCRGGAAILEVVIAVPFRAYP